MREIKINDIVYGTDNASNIIYKNTTVEEKLDTIPVFDPSDNAYIEANQYDYLTYGHIINHLDSDASDKVLSAKQGKILNEKFNNIDFSPLEAAIGENAAAIESLGGVSSDNTDKINSIFLTLEDMMELIKNSESPIILRITADEQLIGKTLTITNDIDIFSIKVSSINFDFKVNGLGLWKIINPITGKIHEVDIKYYGIYELNVTCYRKFSVIIDHSIADPEAMCTYADNAIGMTPGGADWFNEPIFKDLKNCILVNGAVLGYLNKNNLALFEDGTSANITTYGNDVMTEIPRTGYRFEWLDSNRLKVSITDNPNDSNFNYDAFSWSSYNDCDKIYIGTYEGRSNNSKLYSTSGVSVQTTGKIASHRTWARARGNGYELFSFNALKLIQCLFIIFFKSVDAQTCCGKGYTSTSGVSKTGNGNTDGFMSENLRISNPSRLTNGQWAVKCFGIENLWGNAWTFIDGFMTNSNGNFCVCEYANNSNSNATNYLVLEQGPDDVNHVYMTKPIGTAQAGFLLKNTGGSDTSFYCDVILVDRGQYIAAFGGAYRHANGAGLFAWDMYETTNKGSADIGSRLMYYHREGV